MQSTRETLRPNRTDREFLLGDIPKKPFLRCPSVSVITSSGAQQRHVPLILLRTGAAPPELGHASWRPAPEVASLPPQSNKAKLGCRASQDGGSPPTTTI